MPGSSGGPRRQLTERLAAQRAPGGALQPGVGTPRAGAHAAGDLVREAEALPSDRVRDGRAVRDLLHHQPQLLAVEQPLDRLVQQPALHHPRHQPLRSGARQRGGDHALELGAGENSRHGPLGDAVGEHSVRDPPRQLDRLGAVEDGVDRLVRQNRLRDALEHCIAHHVAAQRLDQRALERAPERALHERAAEHRSTSCSTVWDSSAASTVAVAARARGSPAQRDGTADGEHDHRAGRTAQSTSRAHVQSISGMARTPDRQTFGAFLPTWYKLRPNGAGDHAIRRSSCPRGPRRPASSPFFYSWRFS